MHVQLLIENKHILKVETLVLVQIDVNMANTNTIKIFFTLKYNIGPSFV